MAVAIGLPGLAHAEANPYYLGVSAGVGHMSNITFAEGGTRRPDDNAPAVRADLYSTLGIVGGIDQPFGRQRFYANGGVFTNKFQDETRFDNTSYNLAAGLDWSTVCARRSATAPAR
jgi:hypothetical protein